jgi:hypothetical protein
MDLPSDTSCGHARSGHVFDEFREVSRIDPTALAREIGQMPGFPIQAQFAEQLRIRFDPPVGIRH